MQLKWNQLLLLAAAANILDAALGAPLQRSAIGDSETLSVRDADLTAPPLGTALVSKPTMMTSDEQLEVEREQQLHRIEAGQETKQLQSPPSNEPPSTLTKRLPMFSVPNHGEVPRPPKRAAEGGRPGTPPPNKIRIVSSDAYDNAGQLRVTFNQDTNIVELPRSLSRDEYDGVLMALLPPETRDYYSKTLHSNWDSIPTRKEAQESALKGWVEDAHARFGNSFMAEK